MSEFSSNTLTEVAQHLGLAEDYVPNSMKHLLTSYESSDHQVYYEPYSVQKVGERIARNRQVLNKG